MNVATPDVDGKVTYEIMLRNDAPDVADDGSHDKNDDDDTNLTSCGKRGRKKGEEGFGCADNVRRFNDYGVKVEALFYRNPDTQCIRSWIEVAMSMVNKELVEVADDGSDLVMDDCNPLSTKAVPFVPQIGIKIILYPV